MAFIPTALKTSVFQVQILPNPAAAETSWSDLRLCCLQKALHIIDDIYLI
jgi:hypothetical protein